jgi:hypothetical protein
VTRRSITQLVGGVVLAVAMSGCSVSGLSFVQDKRVSIVHPKNSEETTLPLKLEWTAKDFDGYYAVFFDRSPMKPGQNLQSLVPDNDPCRTQDVCPDAAWLADRHIYVTDRTSLEIPQLPDRRDNNRSKDRHEFVIVLLDASGTRVGESVFTNEFIIERED